MRHLSLEDLARLVDEAPEAGEAAHLRDCIACRLELAEMRAQTEELAELPAVEPPAALWDRIEARLVEEGLSREMPAARPVRRVIWLHPALRTAAAVVLLIGAGAAAGWLLRGHPTSPGTLAAGEGTRRTAAEPSPAVQGAQAVPADAGTPPSGAADPDLEGARPSVASFASAGGPRPGRQPSAAEVAAERALRRAERDYAAALRRYAEIADPASGADAATRLRALDGIVAATGDALDRDPGDPVANGFHLAAMEERQRVLRQVASQNESTWY
jgi:hypothetical protein